MEKGSIYCVIKGDSCSLLFNNLVILIVIIRIGFVHQSEIYFHCL